MGLLNMIQSKKMPTLKQPFKQPTQPLTQKLSLAGSPMKIYGAILAVALVSGVATGYVLASSKSGGSPVVTQQGSGPATHAQQDTRTFRDFAEGVVQKKPDSKNGDYSEGTHVLIRQNAVPVALTSSVVDLSEFEGKKVKVFGETQKAVKEGWLMDVGRVEAQ
jgi:hypothetical protein